MMRDAIDNIFASSVAGAQSTREKVRESILKALSDQVSMGRTDSVEQLFETLGPREKQFIVEHLPELVAQIQDIFSAKALNETQRLHKIMVFLDQESRRKIDPDTMFLRQEEKVLLKAVEQHRPRIDRPWLEYAELGRQAFDGTHPIRMMWWNAVFMISVRTIDRLLKQAVAQIREKQARSG